MSPNKSSICGTAITVSLLSSANLTVGHSNQPRPAFISNKRSSIAQCSFAKSHLQPAPWHSIYSENAHSRHILSSTMQKGRNNPRTDDGEEKPKVSYSVIYQKVLRARSKGASHTFLLDLITYLQSVYELPDGLAMPYETSTPDEDDNEDRCSSDNRAILVINSPLADDPTQARLEVEVIGIFPETEGDDNVHVGPKMVMVALKKVKSKNSGNSVTAGLFSDCEKRIIQSLDRGLQDLEEGSLSIPSPAQPDKKTDILDEFNDLDDDGIDAAIKRMGYQNVLNAASSDVDISSKDKSKNVEIKEPKHPISIERDDMGNVIIDSVATSAQKPYKKQSPLAKTRTKVSSRVATSTQQSTQKEAQQTKASATPDLSKAAVASTLKQNPKPKVPPKISADESEDYAVIMARKQAEALMTTAKIGRTTSSIGGTINISGGESEFAIMAAKRAAALQSKKPSKSLKGQEAVDTVPIKSDAKVTVQTEAQDLSNDEMLKKLQSIANKAKGRSWNKTIHKKGTQPPKRVVGNGPQPMETSIKNDVVQGDLKAMVPSKVLEEPSQPKSEVASKATSPIDPKPTKERNLNVNVFSDEASNQKSDGEIREDIAQIARENKQVQDLLKSATDMLPNDGDEDLEPEELLKRVLKFGDEKEKEEKPGFGFVEGAMRKAKDLLRSEQSTESNNNEIVYKEIDREEEMKRKAEEDQLKKIFAAGQTTAQGKLSKPISQASDMMKAPITEEDIDRLIEADNTVPLNARVLDDELAELEVRMSRSPDEESDTPAKNELFDVFSGPETYNPNVDPATAVNWPGAKEGTRTDVKLAKELEMALKQAKFAAAVLTQMREEETDGKTRYFVGERELTEGRVNMLRKCVEESVKAGIIEDPRILLDERARLQMLIDELSSQPEERLEEISLNYKDLLLSDNFIDLVRERLYNMAQRDLAARQEGTEDLLKNVHAGERAIMINLAQIAQGLVKETQALGAQLEVSMLEIIRSICEVAMDPSHTTEQETAMALTDAVRDMRPLLDDAFVAYLKFAIAEEEASLERQGVVDDPEYNRWLFVLKIVQEGVYAELARGVRRYIDHIGYVLRMKTKAERRDLLAKLIEVMPTMDVRPFVKVVGNIVGSLGTSVKGDFADGVLLGDMTNKLLQLQRDVDDILPPDVLKERSRDADNWAAAQRQKLLERQKTTRQRLRAARQTGSIDPDQVRSENAEYDRFD